MTMVKTVIGDAGCETVEELCSCPWGIPCSGLFGEALPQRGAFSCTCSIRKGGQIFDSSILKGHLK